MQQKDLKLLKQIASSGPKGLQPAAMALLISCAPAQDRSLTQLAQSWAQSESSERADLGELLLQRVQTVN